MGADDKTGNAVDAEEVINLLLNEERLDYSDIEGILGQLLGKTLFPGYHRYCNKVRGLIEVHEICRKKFGNSSASSGKYTFFEVMVLYCWSDIINRGLATFKNFPLSDLIDRLEDAIKNFRSGITIYFACTLHPNLQN